MNEAEDCNAPAASAAVAERVVDPAPTAGVEEGAARRADPSIASDGESVSRLLFGSGLRVAVFAVVLLVATVRLWEPPSRVPARLYTPDGAEYVAAAHRFVATGRYEIVVDGRTFPPRYPPIFPLTVIAPAYLFTDELGYGIVPVFVLSVLGVTGAYVAGFRLAGLLGASASATAVLAHPEYVRLARTVMTDAPTAAMYLLALAVLLGVTGGATRADRFRHWAAGVLVALASGTRILSALLVAPFVLLWARRDGRAAALARLLAPLALVLAVTAWYQHRTFGDVSRTGYHFWSAVPYDLPGETLGFQYFWDNVDLAATSPDVIVPVLVGLAGWLALRKRQPALARRTGLFLCTAALPISLVHLLYFYPDARFHLPLAVTALAAGAAGLLAYVPANWRRRLAGAAAVMPLAALAAPVGAFQPELLARQQVMLESLPALPDDAVLITGMDPVRLDPLFLRGTRRTWVAASRRQEYANHFVAPFPLDPRLVPIPYPGTHRHPLMLRCGAHDSVRWTAEEDPEQVAEMLRAGRPVYFDTTVVPPGSNPYNAMDRRFEMTPLKEGSAIYRLTLPTEVPETR